MKKKHPHTHVCHPVFDNDVEQSETFCLRKSSSSSPIFIIIIFRVHETQNLFLHELVLRRAGNSSSLKFLSFSSFCFSFVFCIFIIDAKLIWIICEWIGKQKLEMNSKSQNKQRKENKWNILVGSTSVQYRSRYPSTVWCNRLLGGFCQILSRQIEKKNKTKCEFGQFVVTIEQKSFLHLLWMEKKRKERKKKTKQKLSHHWHRLVIFTNTFDFDSNSIIDARKIVWRARKIPDMRCKCVSVCMCVCGYRRVVDE